VCLGTRPVNPRAEATLTTLGKRAAILLVGVVVALNSSSWAADPAPLILEAKVPLGHVTGRIDHFAVDLARQRLFVAELGNNSVGVIDLKQGQVATRITGLSEPQGVGYVPWTDTLYVANAGDGSVHLYQGDALTPAGRIELGEDADNIRVDINRKRVFIGYGKGALAEIDPISRTKVADIPLSAHPEAFNFDVSGTRIFVNLPDTRRIAIIDTVARREIGTLPTGGARGNFPLAFDTDADRVIVAFRSPPKLMAFDSQGKAVADVAICGDADDIFVDRKRHRVYVSCGDGVIDVLSQKDSGYERIALIGSASGARTSLLVPEMDRLFVGVRATLSQTAAVLVFRPTP
jgi:YVTN family beta-propeller protein